MPVDNQKCEQRKKWNCLVYKGESFLRFPASCLQCGTIFRCLAEMDESCLPVEKPCGGCIHEPSIVTDEEGTLWGSDRDCETCIRMIGIPSIPKDNYQARQKVEGRFGELVEDAENRERVLREVEKPCEKCVSYLSCTITDWEVCRQATDGKPFKYFRPRSAEVEKL